MRASFLVWLALTGAACTSADDSTVHGVRMDGGGSEAGGCALVTCIGGGGDGSIDAGTDGDADAALDDGATLDGGLVCQTPSGTNRMTPVTGQSMMLPFTVQHVFYDWDSSTTCSSPILHLALTDGMFCGDPTAQQLDIYFPTSPLLAPTTMVYTLSSTAGATISVLYHPPTTVPLADQGTVGPCAMPGGMITFDMLSWPGRVTGSIAAATLYPCAAPVPQMPTWTVEGSFDVPILTGPPSCTP